MWWNCKIDPKSFKFFKFCVHENKTEFEIHFDGDVSGNNLDILFVLCTDKDFQKLTKWMQNKIEYKRYSNGRIVYDKDRLPVTVAVPKPQIQTFFEDKTNILNRTVDLSSGTYALLIDNTYSMITGKDLNLHIVEKWKKENVKKDLAITQQLDRLPSDVATCINDANNCYVAGHYNQCSIMLRKGIELAIKTKLLQLGLPSGQLLNETGNELGLSSKIKLLKNKNLLTSRNSSDIERIKWFGDVGAHGTMRVTEQDIKDNVEPKIRSLFHGLELRI